MSRVMKIGLTSETLSQIELTDAREVDDPAAADGGSRRRQRRDLGPARPAAPGAGRSRSAARATTSRSTTVVDGDARRGRRSRPAASSTRRTSGWRSRTSPPVAVDDRRISAPRPSSHFRDTAPPLRARRRRRRGRGLPAADRRRRHQRRPGPAADRREAARRQHAGGDARRRGGARGARSRRCRASTSTPTIFRPATFIEMSLRQPEPRAAHRLRARGRRADRRSCTTGGRRSSACIAIPLSLVAAALVLRYRGGTINTMVLAGLVIALGEVVDDAIIDVENIVRRLRLNRGAGPSAARASQVVLDASLEVRSAVVYASLIVVAGVPAGVLPRGPGRARSSGRWRWPTCWRSWRRCSSR